MLFMLFEGSSLKNNLKVCELEIFIGIFNLYIQREETQTDIETELFTHIKCVV